jgi:hypothetical protein
MTRGKITMYIMEINLVIKNKNFVAHCHRVGEINTVKHSTILKM